MKRAHPIAGFIVVPLIFGAMQAAIAAEPENLIMARSGDLPILLTVPHGGSEGVPGVRMRTRGVTSTDAYTIELAQALAKNLATILGGEPYMVAARFSRKHIDANRPESEAIDAPDAKPPYDAYHNQVRLFVRQIKARFPPGAVLLDIHGQAGEPGVLHRGTQNGATVAALVRNHGAAALTGPASIFGAIHSRGYKVFPPNTPINDPPEDRRYNGGYTVRTYGSGTADGLDAIQLEVGRDLRTDARFIAALAEAVADFYKAFLPSGLPRRADAGGLIVAPPMLKSARAP